MEVSAEQQQPWLKKRPCSSVSGHWNKLEIRQTQAQVTTLNIKTLQAHQTLDIRFCRDITVKFDRTAGTNKQKVQSLGYFFLQR